MRIRIHALVQYSDDLDHVSDPVVNHVGPFEEFAVAGIDFVAGVADRVVLLSDGVIAEQGTPSEVLDNPTSDRGKAFLAQLQSEAKDGDTK
jgi:hypothetical protein